MVDSVNRSGHTEADGDDGLLIAGGLVLTMWPSQPRAEAVAARGGRIAAVGTLRDMAAFLGSATYLDLEGRTLLPGFIETHSHFSTLGLRRGHVDCSTPPNRSISDLQQRLALRAAETPDGQWIIGERYDDTLLTDMRHPDRRDLDAVSTQHPILLWHVSHHIVAVNSYALDLAGIGRDTPDQYRGLDGEIVRDSHREPTGVLKERGARYRVTDLLPRPDAAAIQQGMQAAAPAYLAAGVTSLHDAGVGGNASAADETQAYLAAIQATDLPRIWAMYRVETVLDWLEGRADQSPSFHTGSRDDRFKAGPIKITQDGSIQGLTGALRDPYLGPPHGRGILTFEQERFNRLVERAHAAGYQLAIHTNGDRAIDSALDAIARAQQAHPRPDARHRLEHCQMASDEQLDRMAELGIHASFFIKHVYYWGDRHRDLFLGPERARRIDPLASADRAGVVWALHSDCPVTPIDPLFGVWCAVNRITRNRDVLGPEQRVSVERALSGYTRDAARLSFEEADKGAIEPGKLADFVVLDRDPTAVDPTELRDLRVEMTIIGGKIVHERTAAGPLLELEVSGTIDGGA